MSILVHYLTKFHLRSSSILCNLFQAAACDTWERIAFSRTRPRMKVHETSITQNLVYELNLLKWQLSIPGINIYESTNEAAHGDDLEICLVNRRGRVQKYAVQSKILYHNLRRLGMIRLDDGQYRQFNHTVGSTSQIDLLLDYANSVGAIPLYLLYNYVAGTAINGSACNVGYDVAQFGCSIVSASHLKLNYSDATGNLSSNVRFSHLHPTYAVPWFMLVCCFYQFSISEIKTTLKLTDEDKLIEYSVEEIERDTRGWNLLGPVAESRTNIINDYKEPPLSFFPKFRIVVAPGEQLNRQ